MNKLMETMQRQKRKNCWEFSVIAWSIPALEPNFRVNSEHIARHTQKKDKTIDQWIDSEHTTKCSLNKTAKLSNIVGSIRFRRNVNIDGEIRKVFIC